jgi:hypothetical protein
MELHDLAAECEVVFGRPLSSVPGPEVATTEGLSQIFTLGTILDGDNTETLSNLTALVSWGDGSAPTAASLSGGNGQLAVMGSHTCAQGGVYEPQVSASNGPSANAVCGVGVCRRCASAGRRAVPDSLPGRKLV